MRPKAKVAPTYILSFNVGSSSVRCELFIKQKNGLKSIYRGHIDSHGKPIKYAEVISAEIKKIVDKKVVSDLKEISIVGHRVVHGGEKFTSPIRITTTIIKEIEKLNELAPLHNPPNIAGIRAAQKLLPKATHIAVFDTAFHSTMPEKAYLYGLPYQLFKKRGIRRYGFHGISHEYVFTEVRKKLGVKKTQRTITCHLGNGCSMTAIKNGKVIDTSMGFTPLEGLPMGTRSGDFDPAIIFHLLHKGFLPSELNLMLQKHSGLKGVSGISSDVRDLWAAYKKRRPAAVRTLRWFAYRIAKYIGSYTVALGGLDCLVFTGGVGEHASYLRKWVLEYVNKVAKPKVVVIPTHEEKLIAEKALATT